MKIAPARGDSNGVSFVIILSAGAELDDATRTTAEEKAYIYWAWACAWLCLIPPFNQFLVS